MAGGNLEPGTSAPAQMPPTYGPQPAPMYAQPYGPPAAPVNLDQILRKTFLIIIVLIGALLMFIGKLLGVYAGDPNALNTSQTVSTLGAFMVAGPAIVWALGSKRTTDSQNLGLLILAALLLALYGGFLAF